MEKSKTTIYHLILDRSGSMKNCIHQTVASFNAQISTIQEVAESYPDQEFLVSLTVFDDKIIHLLEASKVSEVILLSPENYLPKKRTALLDAIGESVSRIDEKFASHIENKTVSIVMVILTDGQENASKKYSYASIARILQEKEESTEWTISFLAADIDLTRFAQGLNIRSTNIRNFSKRDFANVTTDINHSFRDYAKEKSLGRTKKDFLSQRGHSNSES